VADVHGLVQLDGADPVPFCQLKQVHNPLAQALQEAYLAIDRIRARPPRMAAPAPAAPAVRRPESAPASPKAAASPPPIPTPHQPPATANPPKQKPVGQQSLF
jgi:hypothetical protein